MQDEKAGGIESAPGAHTDISSTQGMVWLGVLVVLAAITRVYGIWEWSITGDEFYTVEFAAERAWRLVGSAYYILLLASTSLFGSSEWAARLPSVLIGVATIPFFYIMGQRFWPASFLYLMAGTSITHRLHAFMVGWSCVVLLRITAFM